MWRLKADGSLIQSGDMSSADVEVILFEDGCGFSEATLTRRAEPDAHIIAKGALIPDQARMVFQSGVDEILLDDAQLERYSSEAWQQALSSSVTSLYAGRGVSRLNNKAPIWQRRHKEKAGHSCLEPNTV